VTARTIMVIVDSEEMYSGIGLLLEKRGYKVMEAAHDAQTLEKVREAGPDLILMDTDIPAAKSLVIARGLRERARLHDSIIVVLTTQKMPRLQGDTVSVGHNDYVIRQGDFERLKNILTHLHTGALALTATETSGE